MHRIAIDYRDYFRPIVEALRDGGILLVSTDSQGRPNPMTIGWATLGTAWGRELFVAMIRPSRYTYQLVEECGDFTVNVLPKSLAAVLSYCGTQSGREVDKFATQRLTAVPGKLVKSPTIGEAVLSLECRVVHKCDMAPQWLDPAIDRRSYPNADYHRFYFGEILAGYADPGWKPLGPA